MSRSTPFRGRIVLTVVITIPPQSLASLWARLTARAIDGAVAFGLTILVINTSGPLLRNFGIEASRAATVFFLVAVPALEFFGTARWGATPGKVALGLAVKGADGSAASLRIAAIRTLTISTVLAIWPLGGLVLIGALFSLSRRDRRLVYDRLSRTRVVVVRPRQQPRGSAELIAGSAIGAVTFLAVQIGSAISAGIPEGCWGAIWLFYPARSAALMAAASLGTLVVAGIRSSRTAFGAFAAMIALTVVSLLRVL